MCDVRKTVFRWVVAGVALGLLSGTMVTAKAQKKKPQRARRETNASRQARIARTVDETYAHRYEIFGGGGYLRFRSGEYLKKNNEVNWNAGLGYYLSPKLGIIGTAQGSFGNAKAYTDNTYGVEKPQINEYFFMAGPNYRFYRTEKFAVSAQAQGGIGWGIFGGGSKNIPPALLGLWPDQTRAAFSLAVNGDYNIYPNLAFRVAPTYLGTTFGGHVQNNVGINAGIIYRFGHQ